MFVQARRDWFIVWTQLQMLHIILGLFPQAGQSQPVMEQIQLLFLPVHLVRMEMSPFLRGMLSAQ